MDLDPPTSTKSESSSSSNSESTIDNCQFVNSLLDPILDFLEIESSLNIASSSTSSIPNSHLISSTSELGTMATDSASKPGFNLNLYAFVPKLTSGSFNDWKLQLTTILGAQRLDIYILTDVQKPSEPTAVADYVANSMTALTALHITVDSENFQVIRN